MNKHINTKEQRHYSIRKVSGKAVSVFIGATIFSIALGAGVPVSEVHAATDATAVTTSSTTNSQKTSETSSNADLTESSESASNSAATSNSSTSSSEQTSSVNDESSTSSSASADESSASTSNKTNEAASESSASSSEQTSSVNDESSTSSSASADQSSASTSDKTKQATASAVNKPLIRTPDTYAPSASVALPKDYPSEFNTDQYKDYYVFKGIYDAESGTTYYGAVMNDGSQAGTVYIFSEKNGQISGPLEVEKGKQQSDGNVTLYNYGDTYTVALPVGHNDLNYAYSSDGEKNQ
ncbi:YSIRK-type signal peptide-containing protein [Lactobacillus corticis]|uniref:YSIRK-type signal peptide-containing protein n=1 Tax=Lactobacillus corticis TaxID=2201249 RepID=A0A916QFE7_9LACO|nr:YSIRK-type signal peptide-containing protein [Lactobacillus corticis]GFZ26291.1 hypothetical protein LCB40_01710 [Lactobacillus corticis]